MHIVPLPSHEHRTAFPPHPIPQVRLGPTLALHVQPVHHEKTRWLYMSSQCMKNALLLHITNDCSLLMTDVCHSKTQRAALPGLAGLGPGLGGWDTAVHLPCRTC